jgi:hypothetical protein
MRPICHALRWTLAAALVLYAQRALATPGFPGGIRTDLGLTYQPACSLCHADGITGRGTVTTPFGAAMRQRGLLAGDAQSLARALAAMDSDKVDSDGDGIPDIQALRAGLDPNIPGGTADVGQPPAYGCGARVAAGRGSSAGPESRRSLIGAVVGVWAIVRGTRRRGPRTIPSARTPPR